VRNDDLADAIRRGEVEVLPGVANTRPDGQRTLLHVATDWPGHFPNVRQTIERLAAHGAELNAAFHGSHAETPLHWAAYE
jgi:uncharacterized protein